MAVTDIYSTRALMAAIRQLDPPSNFLLNTFFNGTPNTFASDMVEVDIEKRERRLAPYVHPLMAAKAEPRAGYTTNFYKPPCVKPMRESSAADFLRRPFAASPYDDLTIGQQAANLMVKDLAAMDDSISRREEQMAGETLTTGKLHVVGDGVDETIDFLWTASHLIASTALTGGAGWNGGNANPILDLQAAVALLLAAGFNARKAVFGAQAWGDFISNTKVQDYFNILRIIPGQVTPAPGQVGGRMMGDVDGIELWVYSDSYVDSAGAVQTYIPTDHVIIGATDSRAERNYGAIPDLQSMQKVRRWSKSWEENNPSLIYVMMYSSPLPVAHQPDAFVRLDTRA